MVRGKYLENKVFSSQGKIREFYGEKFRKDLESQGKVRELRICQRVWKTVKSQRKIREKSGNFEVDDKRQPWFQETIHCGFSLELLHFMKESHQSSR